MLKGSFEHCLEREAVPSIPDVGKLYDRDAQQSANRLVYTRLDLGGILSFLNQWRNGATLVNFREKLRTEPDFPRH